MVGEVKEDLFEKLMIVRLSADQEVDVKEISPLH